MTKHSTKIYTMKVKDLNILEIRSFFKISQSYYDSSPSSHMFVPRTRHLFPNLRTASSKIIKKNQVLGTKKLI